MVVSRLRAAVACAICVISSLQGGVSATLHDDVSAMQVAVTKKMTDVPPLKKATHVMAEGMRPRAYKTRGPEGSREKMDMHRERYQGVAELVAMVPELSHSAHILDYVSELEVGPSLVDHVGCLYLPNEATWESFYSYVEHPLPPLFAHLVANAFHPNCGNRSLSGATMELCDGGIRGTSQNAPTCLSASEVGESMHGIRVFQVDGMVGIPAQWLGHVERVDQDGGRNRRAFHWAPPDTCRGDLPKVPTDKILRVRMKFIVCYATSVSASKVTREMLRDQATWMNEGYSGNGPYNRMFFDREVPQQVDMQMQFELADEDIHFVEDPNCAMYSFNQMNYAAVHNSDPGNSLTVVFVSDDESGILGMSNFPTETRETDASLVTIVSAMGVRGFGRRHPELVWDLTYDEGDTLTHEAGHSLGLFHTFQGGCKEDGDTISDTNPEAFAHYTCRSSQSCSLPDPVHNFMDYTPDSCLSGFTEMQKRRAWCIMERYRPQLFNASLRQL